MKEADIRRYAALMNELDLTGMEINENEGTVRLERAAGHNDKNSEVRSDPVSYTHLSFLNSGL